VLLAGKPEGNPLEGTRLNMPRHML
jgi:hypothetical protein